MQSLVEILYLELGGDEELINQNQDGLGNGFGQ